MAMVVKNNLPAQLTLGQLNKNINEAGKLLGKLSNGQKINSAKDDVSNYAISEKMREQIRSLTQDNQNVQNGHSLFKIAEQAVDTIVEELRNLKELAINSANDTNSDVDRQIIQKEFNHKIANINDIATSTNYNKIPLLDGTWSKTFDPNATTTQTITEEVVEEKIVGESTTTLVRINNDPIPLTAGDHQIVDDGVYLLKSGFTGNLIVNAQNVKFIGEGLMQDVYITGPGGGANLWIENFNVQNNRNKNFIKFQGSGNYLNFKGDNNFSSSIPSMTEAVIQVGGGLTVEGGTDGTGVFTLQNSPTYYYGAIIGSGESENISSSITVNNGIFNSHSLRAAAAFIGSGGYGGIGDLIINGGTFNNTSTNAGDDAVIGGGNNAGNIYIENATFNVSNHSNEVAIGSSNGRYGAVGDIEIKNSIINYQGNQPAVGQGGYSNHANGSTGDITIDNCQLNAIINNASVPIVGGNVGNITIKHSEVSSGLLAHSNLSSTIDTSQLSGFTPITFQNVHEMDEPENTSETPQEIIEPIIERTVTYVTKTVEIPGGFEYNPLKIHHGTKANQATNFYINDMHTKSLRGEVPNFSDRERLNSLWGSQKIAYQKVLDEASGKSLDDVDVTTQKKSEVAIRVIDGALDYALNEATNLGSYLQKLSYTESNLVTMNENVQSSESTIRDADMAKEMTNYTKANVLTQAAQSMLAQANQSSSQVLSLLQ